MRAKELIDQIVEVTSWEMTGLASPIFLVLLSAVIFFFIPSVGGIQGAGGVQGKSDLLAIAANDLFSGIATEAVTRLYVPLVLTVSFCLMNAFTREFDSGLAKFYLSLPASRLAIFIGKLLASFLLIGSIEISGSLLYAYLLDPVNFLSYFCGINNVIVLSYCLFSELFFIFGVTTFICLLAPKSWVAVALSTFSLYSFQFANELQPQLVWFLPPHIFLLSPLDPLRVLLGVLLLVLSAGLLLLSAYLFVRKVQVS